MNFVLKMNNLKRKMNKFIEMDNLPRLNQEELENINRLITCNEFEIVIKKKNSQQTKVQSQMASQMNSTKHLEKN